MVKKISKTKKKTKTKKKAKTFRKSPKKFNQMTTFENIENFDRPFVPAIRVRAIRRNPQRRVNFVLGNLLLFIIIFVFSSVLYISSAIGFSKNLFFVLSLIFGGLSVAFLIILLSLVFLRILNQ